MRSVRGRAFVDGHFVNAEIRFSAAGIEQINEVDDVPDQLILPGFIDLHVHGGAGADFMDGDVDATRKVCHFHATHGTTSLAATTLSASDADTMNAVASALKGRRSDGAAEIVALHFEGPYLNADFAGAQDRASIRPAKKEELRRWIEACGDLAVTMTIAPEIPGALDCIERFSSRVVFSLGHSAASEEEAARGFAAGARKVTHLFNAMPPLHHRQPGLIGAAAADERVYAEVIADGQHVARTVLQLATRLFDERLLLVTDAMRACGMPEGTYRLYEHEVQVRDGAARLATGALAGSVLTMDAAVRNMHEAGSSFESVIAFATSLPARLLGLERKGKLLRGADADLVVMTPELQITEVWARGERIEE
jgi:N-acetylglucosamine-6-phosphate deacetylase